MFLSYLRFSPMGLFFGTEEVIKFWKSLNICRILIKSYGLRFRKKRIFLIVLSVICEKVVRYKHEILLLKYAEPNQVLAIVINQNKMILSNILIRGKWMDIVIWGWSLASNTGIVYWGGGVGEGGYDVRGCYDPVLVVFNQSEFCTCTRQQPI